MVDNFRWMGLIQSNLIQLTKSTVIDTDLVVGLFEKNLISDEERHLFMDDRTPNVKRATSLYTTTLTKWIDSDFERFKMLLLDTGNIRAFQILTNTPPEALLVKVSQETQKEIEILKQLEDKVGGGAYEGLSLEEEETANAIAAYSRGSKVVMDGVVQLDGSLDKEEVILLLTQFEAALKEGHIWWNPQKTNLPSNFIERKVSRSSQFFSDGSLPPTAERKALLEEIEDLVLLVDNPGMGKSTEMSDLELKLRIHIPNNRIILRINLIDVQRALSTISNDNSTEDVLKLVPFVPLKTLQMDGVQIYVLLDGHDEVCPKYEAKMINLLKVLRPTNFNTADFRVQMNVIVTMRPHLRDAMESAFNVESFSLVPLQVEEQNNYIQAELVITSEELAELCSKFEESLRSLLTNPLMLFMLVEILKTGVSVSELTSLNIYDLYSRFVSSKHQVHLVTKKRMRAGDNYTDLEVETMLERNLRFYFHVAWNQLLRGTPNDSGNYELPAAFHDCIGSIAGEPSSSILTELLSYGLLMKNSEDRLVFKHKSFAEFFYASLLFHPETPQEVRDTLFNFIYRKSITPVLGNVETFIAAALTKTNLQSNFHLTAKWLLVSEYMKNNCSQFSKFVGGKLFHLLIRETLLTFVNGDTDDLISAYRLLVERRSRDSFAKIFEWMRKNRDWSREHLLKTTSVEWPRYSPAVAKLIVAIATLFEVEDLLTEDEVADGFKSCVHLLYTMSCIQTENGHKWETLEKHFGKTAFKFLINTASDADFNFLIESDAETVWKLWTTFSREELLSLVSKEETRVSDAVGKIRLSVIVTFGEDFIPYKSHVAKFRGKFGRDKGNTLFELGDLPFALELLWEDLLKEAKERNSEGPVTVGLREALARNGGSSFSSKLLQKLEEQIRKRRRCPCDSDEAGGMIGWVVNGGSLWNKFTSLEFEMLPFLLHYSGSPDDVTKLLQQNKSIKLEDKPTLMCLLKSLVLSTHEDNSNTYLQVKNFLQQNLRKIPPKWKSFVQTFASAEKDALKASLTLRPSLLVSDVTVGLVFISLIKESSPEVEFPWQEIVRDVIRDTRCCDFHNPLAKLKTILPERKLRGILLSDLILAEWRERFWPSHRMETDYACAMRGVLCFYFNVFGFNLDWMTEGEAREGTVRIYLVLGIPVEIISVLEGNWAHLVPQFEKIVNKLLRIIAQSVIQLGRWFFYETEGEWERLLGMFPLAEEELRLTPVNMKVSDVVAVPFVRVLMKKFPLDETNKECLRSLLQNNHPYITVAVDTMETKASLLHILIELEYLEQVERFTLPGLLLWRNPEGKNALDLAMEKLGEDHQITRHLQNHFHLLNPT